jgi:hypothetical protein
VAMNDVENRGLRSSLCHLPNAREQRGPVHTFTAKARWFVVRFQTEFRGLISKSSRDVLRDSSESVDFEAAAPKAALLRLEGPQLRHVILRYEAEPNSRNAFLILI